MNETLKQLRENNNYSQNSIATFLGISRQMYIKYEQGTIDPPVKVIKNLANFYRVPYEYIIDDKLGNKSEPLKKEVTYKIPAEKEYAVADSGVSYGKSIPSDYLSAITDMLPKLIYSEQLQLLSKLCDMVKSHAQKEEEKEAPSKKMEAFQRILELNKKLHLSSEGRTWTREELYERH